MNTPEHTAVHADQLGKQMAEFFRLKNQLSAGGLEIRLGQPTGEPDTVQGEVYTKDHYMQWGCKWAWTGSKWKCVQCCLNQPSNNLMLAFSQQN